MQEAASVITGISQSRVPKLSVIFYEFQSNIQEYSIFSFLPSIIQSNHLI